MTLEPQESDPEYKPKFVRALDFNGCRVRVGLESLDKAVWDGINNPSWLAGAGQSKK
jgi:hypothetical protein